MKKIVFALMVVLITSSCASVYRQYQGPERSEDQIAVLEHPNPQHSFFIVEDVDGKWRGAGLIKRYELLPGERSITCSLHDPTKTSAKITVYFNAEAGKKYVAQALTKDNKWTVVIREEATGKIVSYYKN